MVGETRFWWMKLGREGYFPFFGITRKGGFYFSCTVFGRIIRIHKLR